MALPDPVAIFTATSNTHAQALCLVLKQSGIEAHVTEDFSLVGMSLAGMLPGIHQPQVWVDRPDAERAAEVLREHEQREAELRPAEAPARSAADVEVVCEECGAATRFPGAQVGSVQECPQCGAYLDVGEGEDEDWGAEAEGEGEE